MVGTLVAFGFLLSTAARNERALFVLDTLQPTALSAMARSADAGPYWISFPGRGGPAGIAAPRGGVGGGAPALPPVLPIAAPFLAGASLPLLAGLAPGVLPRFPALGLPLTNAGAGAPIGDGNALPLAPGLPGVNGAPGNALPGTGTPGTGGPGTGGPGTGGPGTGGTPGNNGSGPGSPDGGTTPAVPEPMEWILLVAGIFALAAALRRKRSQSITMSSPVRRIPSS